MQESSTLQDLEATLAATFEAGDWGLDAAIAEQSGTELVDTSIRPINMDLNDLMGSRPVGN
ncbi:hypothetical protein ABH920_001453 [Catenulispora sp. EB89]|uniref:hypothetical protein n=1 Tax=Catenulispora TaxID=414878 RepID=UPI00189253A6|nr:hypothetical protein [Catenulispora rubra]